MSDDAYDPWADLMLGITIVLRDLYMAQVGAGLLTKDEAAGRVAALLAELPQADRRPMSSLLLTHLAGALSHPGLTAADLSAMPAAGEG